MAISPISAVSYGKYNNITFEGKKKKDHTKHGISTPISHKLAVPLAATVLAMSPMSSKAESRVSQADKTHQIEMVDNINDSGKIVAQKHFTYDLGDNTTLTDEIMLVNSNGSSNTFDKMFFEYTLASPYIDGGIRTSKNPITAFSDITYELISDDGSKGPSFNIKSVNLADNKKPSFLKDEEMNYIEKAINSPENQSDIEINKFTVPLEHNSLGLQNSQGKDTMKDAVPDNYGKNVGSQEFEIESGKYKIGYYSTDGNDDDAETVTLKKNNYPELKVLGVQVHNVVFNEKSTNPTNVRYAVVILGDKRKIYSLFDEHLGAIMLQVFENKSCKPAAEKVEIYETRPAKYDTNAKGKLNPIFEV